MNAGAARRQRERDRLSPDVEIEKLSPSGPDRAIIEEWREICFMILGYFLLRRAICLPIAEAVVVGETLKEYAARLHLSYPKVRQDWVRCLDLIHDAIRKGRLRIEGVNLGNRERVDD